MINRRFFFNHVRTYLFDGKLRQSQVDGLTHILDGWEAGHAKKDDRWLAYMLATAHHETDRKMQPITEYGKGKGCAYGKPDPETGCTYFGRGFVQLTWRENYAAMGRKLKLDLVTQPDLALDAEVASQIMFRGMIDGTFTGRKLSHYFAGAKEDWVNARRIINGLDRANLISGYAKHYYAAISYTTG